jgi:hypothetical protein
MPVPYSIMRILLKHSEIDVFDAKYIIYSRNKFPILFKTSEIFV